ncbi:MAG: hypothetical protein AB7E36_13490 [Salinivirgaceae bacterium]
MNKHNSLLVLGAMALFGLSACVKEKDREPFVNEPTCRLIYKAGDNYSYEMAYDASKRLSTVVYVGSDGTPHVYYASGYTDSKINGYDASTYGSPDFYETYSWTSQELVINYYSLNEYNQFFLEDQYVYTLNSSGQVKRRDWYQDSGYGLQHVGYRLYTWSNNNIVKWEYWYVNKKQAIVPDYIYDGFAPRERLKSTDDSRSYTVTFEYDNHPNAEASVGLFWLDPTFSRNNVTRAVYDYADGSQAISEIEYTYNYEGYPEYSYESYVDREYNQFYYYTYFGYECDETY